MTHIERMQEEVGQLNEKIKSAKDFLRGELVNKVFTDEVQRMALAVQINCMHSYLEILESRIEYDTLKMNNNR